MIELFLSALKITSPIFWALVIGVLFKQLGIIGPQFIRWTNQLFFSIFLPLTLFLALASKQKDQSIEIGLVVLGALFTLVSVLSLWWITRKYRSNEYTGVFVQSAFRGNMGIVGMTLVVGAYGEIGMIIGGFYLGIVTIVYNVCSIILLNANQKNLAILILKNPLIIASVLGLVWSIFQLPLPELVRSSLPGIVKNVLPLALVSIGASLSWSSFRANHLDVIASVSLKLIILPFIGVAVGWFIGFEGMSLGILFMMLAAPSAAASYVMAQQMTQYGPFAAEAVAVSTLASPITITLGLTFLGWLGII